MDGKDSIVPSVQPEGGNSSDEPKMASKDGLAPEVPLENPPKNHQPYASWEE